jgi:hypothetical protein
MMPSGGGKMRSLFEGVAGGFRKFFQDKAISG